jgi:hypothetical protein
MNCTLFAESIQVALPCLRSIWVDQALRGKRVEFVIFVMVAIF